MLLTLIGIVQYFKIDDDNDEMTNIIDVCLFLFCFCYTQMEQPRHKHQTQPLYTAPRLSERLDRASPLNSRRSNADSYHDNKSSTLQNQRSGNKSLRRHSTNAYTSSSSSSSNAAASQKELSPNSSSGLQHQMNNNSSR